MSADLTWEKLKERGFPLFPNSTVRFVRFTCCERFGVEEVVSGHVFYDTMKPMSYTSRGQDAPCPFCGNPHPDWGLADDLDEAPGQWGRL